MALRSVAARSPGPARASRDRAARTSGQRRPAPTRNPDLRRTGQDPHRTLGVPPGADEAEIKRAFRALAKRYHPDAGEGSAARFIEIQAAYATLLGTAAPGPSPAPRTGRRPAQSDGPGSGPGSGNDPGTPAGSTWARRPRTAGSGRAGAEASGTAGANTAGGGASRAGASPAGRTGGAGRHGRGSRRASLGSTSYDDADEVFEPSWAGATWYGSSSGTYWTINPKEYADPRKHGPEYQARARRHVAGAGTGDPAVEDAGPGASGAGSPADDPAAGSAASAETRATPGAPAGRAGRPSDAPAGSATPRDLPPDWGAGSWTAAGPRGAAHPTFDHDAATAPRPTGPAARSGGSPGIRATRAPGARRASTRPSSATAAGPGVAARVVLALVGWAVPALAVAAVAGGPGGLVATLPVQAAGVALLAFRPRLAWAAAGGGLALVFAAIPIVALVAALGGPVVPGEPVPVAAVLAALAWGAGFLVVGSGRVAPFPRPPGG